MATPFTVNSATKPGNPASGGHYVQLSPGHFQLIHAIGLNKWAPGPPTAHGAPHPHGPAPQASTGGVPNNSPLANPNQSLSGKSLLQAAQGLVDAQTVGPLAELAKQIAANNSQTQSAIDKTGGYFHQLGDQTKQGVDQTNSIGAGLNSTLQGIGQGEQSALQGIGNNAMSMLSKYTPQSDAQNSLGAPAAGGLASEIARQQGLAAQNQAGFQSFGAQQGANFGNLAASQLGTFGLKGQEALKGVAQAGQLKNEPLMGKVADIQAARGADLQSAIGKLRQQEITNGITQQGLGIKQQANQIAGQRNDLVKQNNLANQRLKGQEIAVTRQNNIRTITQQNIDNARTNDTSTNNNLRDNATRTAIANLKNRTGDAKPLPQDQQNTLYRHLDEMMTLIQAANKAGHKEPQIRQALSTGQAQKGFPAQSNILIEAAYELLGYGSIDQSTAAAMHSMGLRGGTFRGRPIKVTKNFNPAKSNPATNAGGAVKNAGNAVGNALGA